MNLLRKLYGGSNEASHRLLNIHVACCLLGMASAYFGYWPHEWVVGR